MKEYPWAVNDVKLQLSIAEARSSETPLDENLIKELYVKRGGLLQEVEYPVVTSPVKSSEKKISKKKK